MTTFKKHFIIFVTCLSIGVALAFLISRKPDVPSLAEAPHISAVSPPGSLKAGILGLPTIAYVGESLNYTVHIENSSREAQAIRVIHSDPWSRQERAITLASESSIDIPFPFRVASPVNMATASVSVFHAADPQGLLCRQVFRFRDGTGDLSDIVIAGRSCTSPEGESVVLVNRYEDETQYRRWAPVKWAAREWRRRGAPIVLSAPESFRADEGGLPQGWTLIPYAGDPLSAALNLPSKLPAEGTTMVCLAWGFDETVKGYPVRDFARALDLAIDRLRKHNPDMQIALATPLPSPSMPKASARYAEAIRILAREHHAYLIDLTSKALGEKEWQALYAVGGDENLTGQYPQEDGLRHWAEWLRRGLIDRVSFATAGNARSNQSASPAAVLIEERAAQESETNIKVQFPGIVTVMRPGPFSRAPTTMIADVLIPEDAPRSIHVSLFVKDKDGLWFQSEPVTPLALGRWQGVRFELDPGAGFFSARGHDGAWNACHAAHVVEMGLQFFSPVAWKGEIQVGDIRVDEDDSVQARPIRILNFRQLTSVPTAYETAEFVFDLSVPVSNPFNPQQSRVEAVFRCPSGEEMCVGGFYCQPYRRNLDANGEEVVTPDGEGTWRVRFTPLEAGKHEWKLIAEAGDQSVATQWHPLDVQPGEPHGFIRVSKKDPRYFETADEKFFYPIGQNIHAPTDARSSDMLRVPPLPGRGTYAYDDYFAKMAANGENSVIVWMSNWWVSIEWTKQWKGFNGLGDYNLGNAWRLDHLLDAAAGHGIHVLLVLDNHGKLSKYVDSEWETNPYNATLGGPCSQPEDFFKDPRAFEFYKRRLRYIVARWGSHPNLLGFEIISEINLVGSSRAYRDNPAHAIWVQKVADYLEEIDPYDRPITIQYSNDWQTVDEKVARLPELDCIVGDAYKAGGYVVPLIVETARENGRFGKPTFTAEFGGNWNGTTPARLHADLHAGLWSNAMTTTAGAPFFWWFDFIDRYDIYHEFLPLSRFMEGEDRRGRQMKVSTPDVQSENATISFGAVVLSDPTRADFWVYDRLTAQIRPEKRFIQSRSGVAFKIEGLQKGAYRVEYWDTGEGHVMKTEDVRVEEGDLELQLPTFDMDIAGKVRRLE